MGVLAVVTTDYSGRYSCRRHRFRGACLFTISMTIRMPDLLYCTVAGA